VFVKNYISTVDLRDQVQKSPHVGGLTSLNDQKTRSVNEMLTEGLMDMNCGLPGHNTIQSKKWVYMFWKSLLLPSSGYKLKMESLRS
jgi:hypothetical protein